MPDGGDIEGIIVRVDNKTVLRHPMPTRHGSATDATSLQTGPRDPNFWANGGDRLDPLSWATLSWVPLEVDLDVTGELTVKFKNATLLDKFQTAYFPSAGTIVLAGRTGGANQHTHFDNIRLSTGPIDTDPKRPTILAQPFHQTVRAGNNVAVAVTAGGMPPLSYQWRKGGVNLAGSTSATLTLNSVTAADSGHYSVVVRNAVGSVVSATADLAVLTDGANETKPGQVAPLFCPLPGANVDSLVLVTHGVAPVYHFGGKHLFGDIAWITNMAKAISRKVPANWEVRTLDWTPVSQAIEPYVVSLAGIVGGFTYGDQLVRQQNWKHVHLIGHSAGAAVIDAIAFKLRQHFQGAVTIHETFLDPYLGPLRQWQSEFGSYSDWSDQYFAENGTSLFTGGQLLHAHNVDVTWLDKEHITYLTNYCFPSGMAGTTAATILDQQVPCSVQAYVFSSHGWPYEFYQATVAGDVADAQGYGYSRSKEGEGWADRGQHPPNNPPEKLNEQESFPKKVPPTLTQAPFQFGSLPTATSDFGASFSGPGGFNLNSGQPSPFPQTGVRLNGVRPLNEPGPLPAWLAVGVTVTNAVNFVQFDARFAGTKPAEGLLTVYWNTNQIGMVDERVASPGLQTYRFALPNTETNGLFTLSFRLDAFHQTTSSITVTNVATGFVGLPQPITLESIGLATNGAPVLKLMSAPDYTYLIQVSTNLLDWTPTALLVNTNGTMLFAEPGPPSPTARFYRATLP